MSQYLQPYNIMEAMFGYCYNGNLEGVIDFIKRHPHSDINWQNSGWLDHNCLHQASINGSTDIVVELLKHPMIDVNMTIRESTPLMVACANGHLETVKILLNDQRVSVNYTSAHRVGYRHVNALLFAVECDHMDVVEQLLVSCNVMSTGEGWESAVGLARKFGYTTTFNLLNEYEQNPTATIHRLKTKLGMLKKEVADTYATVIFHSDGLVKRTSSLKKEAASRFFRITKKLPMELQMLLCNRAFGLSKTSILKKDSEVAFRDLAKKLLLKK